MNGEPVMGMFGMLLVDGWASEGPTITLYGEPKGEVYRVLSAGKFGDTIRLPEPFELDLDTSEFSARGPRGSRNRG